ncbi:MAG: aspartate kinase [Bernardetiaceae bacterium]|nr:aspartate kinase [Bernardetiaceae bacterium]
MKVFKFGGASVRDASAVRNVVRVIEGYAKDPRCRLLVVVSAMGKSTNALEDILNAYRKNDKIYEKMLEELESFHYHITKDLFEDDTHEVFDWLKKRFFDLRQALINNLEVEYEQHYDQVISFGELLSTIIVAAYCDKIYNNCKWIDARRYIQTNTRWREGKVDWKWSEQRIRADVEPMLDSQFVITQGFLGGTVGGQTTTLGREGSDYTAAIFAYCLQAESVTIWKDVPGILNADPKRISSTSLFTHISYTEAAEMTYYGASVIHPKTIKPLANRNIPLYVRSFIDFEKEGTAIGNFETQPKLATTIFKKNQSLITFLPRNLASVNETNLYRIFDELSRLNLKINLVQSSATSFSVCTDSDERKINRLINHFAHDFEITVRDHLELVTIKHYNSAILLNFSNLGNAVIEQKSGDTYQIVVSK